MVEPSYAPRRTNPRFPFFADAEIDLQDGMCVPAQISELSSRGCYVDTLQPISVGTEMRLYISYGVNSCELHAKVIYKHTGGGMGIFGMGILFGEMRAEQHSVIEDWLHQLAERRRAAAERDSNTPE